ncbi:MAG TPA: tetratricopeptide repeat protein [Terriglobales bacterium]|nr:tetratricopeptide repeat protein [Terriglobales bacterium]
MPNISRLPVATPDPFALTRSGPNNAAATALTAAGRSAAASASLSLRFGMEKSPWTITDIRFGDEDAPISANLLRTPRKAQQELEDALAAAGRQDWVKAEEHLHQSLKEYPEFSAAYHNLGVIALLRGDNAGGEALIEKALSLDDRSPYALFALAQLRLANDDAAAAGRYASRFLTVVPNHPNGLALLAAIQIKQRRFDDALATFNKLEKREHKALADFHLLSGSLYELKGESGRAIAEYKKYLRESPRGPITTAVNSAISDLQQVVARK